MEDVAEVFLTIKPAEYEKYRDELNFDLSKKIYDEKYAFMLRFGERFAVESCGGIYGIKDIIENGK